MHARFPAYTVFDLMLDNDSTGPRAVGTVFILEMLSDAPDLLQLAMQRFTDEYRAHVFDGQGYSTDVRAWRQ